LALAALYYYSYHNDSYSHISTN